MRLYLQNKNIIENEDKNYLEVSLWSFFKCMVLSQLVIYLIVFGGLFAIGILWRIFN